MKDEKEIYKPEKILIFSLDNKISFLAILYFILILGFMMPCFVFLYLQREDPAYLWDWGGYFNMYQSFGSMIRNGEDWYKFLLSTIMNDDYNYLPISILFPYALAFHGSRFGYLLSIVITYLVPVSLLLTYTVSNILSTKRFLCSIDIEKYLLLLFFFLSFHPFWAPILRGLPDIAGLIPIGCITIILFRTNFLVDASWRAATLMGICCWLTFALRRWYAYSLVSVVLLSLIAAIVYSCMNYRPGSKYYKPLINYSIFSLVSVGLLLYFQLNLFERIISTSYGEAYVGYQRPILVSVNYVYRLFGPVYFSLFIIGFIASVVSKDLKIIFCVLVPILTFILFTCTQAPGIQHLLPIAYWMAIVCAYAYMSLIQRLPKYWKRCALVLLCLYSVAASADVFFPAAREDFRRISSVFPYQDVFPLHVENMSEYRRLIGEIKKLTAEGGKFSVFASSATLADSLLTAFDSSVSKVLVGSSQVDARDFMNISSLRSRYAIVTEMPITHLAPGSQQVIVLPDEDIFAKVGFGKSYEKIAGPFTLSDGNKAFIFRRLRSLSQEDILDLQAQLNKSYPMWKWDHGDMIK